jgi:ABC-type lipoprotein export system ATPase subunit
VDSEQEIMQLLIEINRGQGTTIVMVTHNPELAAAANHHFVMDRGNLSEVVRSAVPEASHAA